MPDPIDVSKSRELLDKIQLTTRSTAAPYAFTGLATR